MLDNLLALTATVHREDPLRYTPIGLPILEVWLNHKSRQMIHDFTRDITCEIQAILIGEDAKKFFGKLAGKIVHVTGFLSQRGFRNPRIVLNIEHVKFLEG
jgi:primosomal replication protein N